MIVIDGVMIGWVHLLIVKSISLMILSLLTSLIMEQQCKVVKWEEHSNCVNIYKAIIIASFA